MNTGQNRYWGNLTPPKSKTEFFDAVTTPAASGDVATIRLYGPIDSWGGWWGISASDVGDVLDTLPDTVTQIVLRINSPGGEVFEAVSILNMLRAHKATVTGVVDGLAASAASVIAAGCAETVMSPGTQMMIHSPSVIAWGNSTDLRKMGDILDSIEQSIIEIYRAKAGESAWGELLSAETWLTAQQAVDLGLADKVGIVKDAGETETVGAADPIVDPLPTEGTAEDRFAAARAHLSTLPALAAAAKVRAVTGSPKPPSSSEPGTPNQKEALAMSDALKAGLSARLGVTDAEISDEALLAAVDEVLAEQTEAAPAVSIPAGTQLIEDNVLAQLRNDANAGREARDEQIRAHRDGIIKDALREGRISAASAPRFRQMLESDESTAVEVIASLAKNTVPVDEIGHTAGEVSAEDALYAMAFGADKEVN